MLSAPLLFDLGARAPTTRTLALRIRAEGATAALDQAQLRADAARYQEVTCRSALNRVRGMPFNWSLNAAARMPATTASRGATRRSSSWVQTMSSRR